MAGLDDKRANSSPPRALTLGGRIFALSLLTAMALPVVASLLHANNRHGCAENLRRIGFAFKMYAYQERHNVEFYPALASSPGRLMIESSQIFPQFLPDPAIGLCPRDADVIPKPAVAIDDWSYFYLGYMVRSDEDMERYAAAYRAEFEANCVMNRDIDFPDDRYQTRTLFRLRDGVERNITIVSGDQVYVPAKADGSYPSKIPILIERLGNHPPSLLGRIAAYLGITTPKQGVHVLYLSGHVEFIEYPGKWPMTEKNRPHTQ